MREPRPKSVCVRQLCTPCESKQHKLPGAGIMSGVENQLFNMKFTAKQAVGAPPLTHAAALR